MDFSCICFHLCPGHTPGLHPWLYQPPRCHHPLVRWEKVASDEVFPKSVSDNSGIAALRFASLRLIRDSFVSLRCFLSSISIGPGSSLVLLQFTPTANLAQLDAQRKVGAQLDHFIILCPFPHIHPKFFDCLVRMVEDGMI